MRFSLSSFILLFVFGTVLTLGLVLFPWSSLTALSTAKRSAFGVVDCLARGGFIFWTASCFLVLRWRGTKAAQSLLSISSPVDLAAFNLPADSLQHIKQLPTFRMIELRCLGRIESAVDDGLWLASSPLAIRSHRNDGSGMTILIPSVYFKRLAGYPKAWEAVLLHELAHFENQDLFLLFEARRLLRAACLIALPVLVLSLLASALQDAAYLSPTAALASLVGKNYLMGAFCLSGMALMLMRRLERWREALADAFVVRHCDQASLQLASDLIRGLVPYPQVTEPTANRIRPTADDRERAYVLRTFDVCVFGFLTGALSDYVTAPVAYLSEFAASSGVAQQLLSLLVSVAGPLITFTGLYWALLVVSQHYETVDSILYRHWGHTVSAMTLGFVLAYAMLQLVPLAITSCAMPDGYDFIERHDLGPLIIAGLATVSVSVATKFALALLGAFVERKSGVTWSGWSIGLTWILLSAGEVAFFPGLLYGGIAYLGLIFTAFFLLWRGKHMSISHPNIGDVIAFSPMCILVCALLFRFGEPGHVAACVSQAAVRYQSRGEQNSATSLFKAAAKLAPHHPQAWADLARSLTKQGRFEEAAEAANRGLGCWYLSSWRTKFSLLVLAGDLNLQMRTDGALIQAQINYEAAESLWRRNSKLSHDEVAHMLYNLACVFAIYGSRDDFDVAVRVFEAGLLDRQLAVEAFKDPDLQKLRLESQPAPHPTTIQTLAVLSATNIATLHSAVESGSITHEEAVRFIADSLRKMRR